MTTNSRSGRFIELSSIAFSCAAATWTTWFITHLPWLGLSEPTAVLIILVVWLLAAVLARLQLGRPSGRLDDAAAGLITAVVGLLVLGSKVMPETSVIVTDRPHVALTLLGFLALGTAIGAVAGLVTGVLTSRGPRDSSADHRLSGLALTAAGCALPLLFIGGLVTSTKSGMAVPDWPSTFGANMFLYPLGPRAQPDVYLEHAHRLFGTLLGCACLALMAAALASAPRRAHARFAVAIFALVCAQGLLGAGRVLEDHRGMGVVHGVLGQLIFGLLIALAVGLRPLVPTDVHSGQPLPPARVKTQKRLAAAFLHTLIVQLIFGAVYRHFLSPHALWTHAAFSIIVVVFALMAAFSAVGLAQQYSGHRALHRLGVAAVAGIALQFILGWVAFFISGHGAERVAAPENAAAALIRTVHQANGAVLLALAMALYITARHLTARPAPTAAPAQTGTPGPVTA